MRVILAFLVAALAASTGSAYILLTDASGLYVVKWQHSPVVLQIKLPTTMDQLDGTSQSSSVSAAMDDWNAQLATVQLSPEIAAVGAYKTGDGTSEIVMDTTIDGDSFSTGTLAVTISYSTGNGRLESDIIFNSNHTWNSYRGALRGSTREIRRVAVHELGHVLGLGHPDEVGQTVAAIMNSHVSDNDVLLTDDITGGRTLYGAPGAVPANNNFADAVAIGALPAYLNGTNISASREIGEPQHATSAVGHSVWWKWTPAAKGVATVSTFGSDFDTVMGVYTGPNVSSLVEIGSNDDEESPQQNSTPQRKRSSIVTFTATAGTTYYIAVDGWASAGTAGDGYTGSVILKLNSVALLAPQFSSQPVGQAIDAGDSALFTVGVSGAPNPTYQWQLSADAGATWSDLANGDVYSGATTATLAVANAASAMNGFRYRCVASNSEGHTSSSAVMLTVRATEAYAGTYFGTVTGGRGDWAMRVNSDRTAVFLAYLSQRKSVVVADFRVTASGSFTIAGAEIVAAGQQTSVQAIAVEGSAEVRQAIASNYSLSGQITAGNVSGQFTGLNETFSGSVDRGAGSAPDGFFSAGEVNGTGASYAVIAASGQTLVVTTTAALVDAASGSAGANGALSTTTASGGHISLSINAATQKLLTTLVPVGSPTTITFGSAGEGTPGSTRLANIATRAYCSTGNSVTIGGFVISGPVAKRVLVRAVGPSLIAQGIPQAEALLDPVVEVHKGAPAIATNDDWGTNANAAEITSVAVQIGANQLQGDDAKSSALLLTLAPGVYTFVVNGKGGTSGVVLLEVYDADAVTTGTNFVNIATRAYARTGNAVTIGGFVIAGSATKRVLLRAVGPTLTTLGIGGAEVLTDPRIELHKGAAIIASNDNWGDNTNAAAIVSDGARIGAAPFDQADATSSALLMNLRPGVYTFIASGRNDSSGIVLVEVYDAD